MGDAEHPDYSRREMIEMMREARSDDSGAIFALGAFFGIIVGVLAVLGTISLLQ